MWRFNVFIKLKFIHCHRIFSSRFFSAKSTSYIPKPTTFLLYSILLAKMYLFLFCNEIISNQKISFHSIQLKVNFKIQSQNRAFFKILRSFRTHLHRHLCEWHLLTVKMWAALIHVLSLRYTYWYKKSNSEPHNRNILCVHKTKVRKRLSNRPPKKGSTKNGSNSIGGRWFGLIFRGSTGKESRPMYHRYSS